MKTFKIKYSVGPGPEKQITIKATSTADALVKFVEKTGGGLIQQINKKSYRDVK